MKDLAERIDNTISHAVAQLKALTTENWEFKPKPEKWSKKEILGHLIDSAQNNTRRFVVGQYEIQPHIIYKQNEWVKYKDHHHRDVKELLQLFELLNRELTHVLRQVSRENEEREVDVSQPDSAVYSIRFIGEDYLNHLHHHLQQLLP